MGIQRQLPRPVHQVLLIGTAVLVFSGAGLLRAADPPKFYPDDPVCCALAPKNVGNLPVQRLDTLYDLFYYSIRKPVPNGQRARAVNTLGEALESEWFTYRHSVKPMTKQELQRGPGDSHPPKPPYTVVGAKLDGVTPGFRIKDSKGDLYFVKADPPSNPEIGSGADVIGSKFFYAIGYNTAENYLLVARRSDFDVEAGARSEVAGGKERKSSRDVIADILAVSARQKDGSYRFLASRAVTGTPIGPFLYEGVRPGDVNDVVPHQNRRDLRGLRVFAAWLNHTDLKSLNSQDALVEKNGVRYVEHHLIDFGAILGSDSDMPKDARFGHAPQLGTGKEIWQGTLNLGIVPKPWESVRYDTPRSVGRVDTKVFDYDTWITNYPNPALIQAQADDEFWAAKIVASFRDEDIRALVETGKYSDPAATEYLTKTLIGRREIVLRSVFAKVLPLDAFRVEGGEVKFTDLAVARNYVPGRSYTYQWARFDNSNGTSAPLGTIGPKLPAEWAAAAAGSYFQVGIADSTAPAKKVTVYLRKTASGAQVVGIERL